MPRLVSCLPLVFCIAALAAGCGGDDDAGEEACGPATDDAVARFSFDTCAGTVPEDVGTGLDATLVGEAACTGENLLSNALGSTWSSSAVLTLDGEEDYAEAPDSPVFEPAQFTVSAWVLSEDYSLCGDGTCTIVSKGNVNVASNGYVFTIVWGTFGPLLRLVICADGQETAIVGTTEVDADVWHHVVATYDGTTARMYLDGQLNGSIQVPHGMTYGDESFLIGSITNRAYDFYGYIEDVVLWDYPKTDDEVEEAYHSYVCP
jgi:hypothetical protein